MSQSNLVSNCPFCSQPIVPEATYCPYCGKPVLQTNAPHDQTAPQSNSPYSSPTNMMFGRDPYQQIGLFKPGLFRRSAVTLMVFFFVILLSTAALIGVFVSMNDDASPIIYLGLALINMMFGLLYTINLLIFVFRSWKTIQDGYAKTTPGKAVGFLFIPFFNIYWMFIAYYGLADGLNVYCNRHQIPGNNIRANSGLVLTTCILSLIPYINFLACFFWIPTFFTLAKAADAVNNYNYEQLQNPQQ